MLRDDFPIFGYNPDLVFLDSTSTAQKPKAVIDGIGHYHSHYNSNIHRGLYDIALESEEMYFQSKKKVAHAIGASDWREIIYTYNANYALNILAQTLEYNAFLKKGDIVLVSILEHHANIVPWLILKNRIGIEVKFFDVDENYAIDWEDFEKKYTPEVKIIACTHVSNVTGEIFDIERIGKLKREDTFFIVDASQSLPHFSLDVESIGCDALFFTGHKLMAETGIGVLWVKKTYLSLWKPIFSGGGAISHVKTDSFSNASLPFTFEPGTPHIVGAVSLLKSFEYIESIGGYDTIKQIEDELVQLTLKGFASRTYLHLIGNTNPKSRVGVFSFTIAGVHALDIAQVLAEENIAIRAGQHCAEPFMDALGVPGTARMSLYIYTTPQDIAKFFQVLDDNFGPGK